MTPYRAHRPIAKKDNINRLNILLDKFIPIEPCISSCGAYVDGTCALTELKTRLGSPCQSQNETNVSNREFVRN